MLWLKSIIFWLAKYWGGGAIAPPPSAPVPTAMQWMMDKQTVWYIYKTKIKWTRRWVDSISPHKYTNYLKWIPNQLSFIHIIKRANDAKVGVMTSAHGPIFYRKQPREKSEWRSDFLSDWISAHGPIIYRRHKIGPTIRSFYRSVMWRTRPLFFSQLLCCDNGRRCRPMSHCWITSFLFLSGWSQRTDRFLIADKLLEGEVRYFLSNQKSAHTNRFSIRFLVYDKKNRYVCAGHKQ